MRIACPDLTTERAAELESRIRANLLTAELPATVLLSCRTERAELRVDAAPESITVHVPIGSVDTLRDDVLRGVEEALQELSRRRAKVHDRPSTPPTAPAPESATAGAAQLPPWPPPVTAPAPKTSSVNEPPAARAWTELFAAALGELWADRLAVGGALGVARSTSTLWFGLRVAALRPAAGSPDFDATDCHASAELGVQPQVLAGFRASVGLGPSVLFITPHGDLTATSGTATTTSTLFVTVHVNRPFWFGQFGLLPDVSARLFTSARGVHVGTEERLKLSGLVPALSLGLMYRLE